MKRLFAFLLVLVLLTGTALAERLPDEQLVTYYEDSVFIGDSITRMFRNYIVNVVKKDHPDYFDDVKFYTAYSYQLYSASTRVLPKEKVALTYKGRDVTMYDIVKALKPSKLFILAGVNDKIGDKIEKGMEYIERIVSLVEKASPKTQVYFFSVTPTTARVEEKRPGVQSRWNAYNVELEKKCQELGAIYIDIATGLKNEEGFLDTKLSHDYEYHLNDDGNAVWLNTLLDFAQSEYEAERWAPAE